MLQLETRIDGYEVEAEIAKTKTSKVLRVRKDGQVSAMKIALEGHERTLIEEGDLHEELNHPHIAKLKEKSFSPTYLVFEYYPKSVRDLLKEQKKLDTCQAIDLTRQVLEGLIYLHGKNIPHRDLKPENLLIAGDGRIVIADLGIAGELHNTNATGEPEGTDAYRAPEQRTEKGDIRSDIYPIGIMLYEFVTGQRPLPKFTPASELCNSPAELDYIIDKCLSEDPARRPTAEEALDMLMLIPQHSSRNGVLEARNALLEAKVKKLEKTNEELELENQEFYRKRNNARKFRIPALLGAAFAGFLLGAAARDCAERIKPTAIEQSTSQYWYTITDEEGQCYVNFPIGLDPTAGAPRKIQIEKEVNHFFKLIQSAEENDRIGNKIYNEHGEPRITYTPWHIREIIKALGEPITKEKCDNAYDKTMKKGGFYEITGLTSPKQY